jgi:hypothetical protein
LRRKSRKVSGCVREYSPFCGDYRRRLV